jgi:hypothetical protein
VQYFKNWKDSQKSQELKHLKMHAEAVDSASITHKVVYKREVSKKVLLTYLRSKSILGLFFNSCMT